MSIAVFEVLVTCYREKIIIKKHLLLNLVNFNPTVPSSHRLLSVMIHFTCESSMNIGGKSRLFLIKKFTFTLHALPKQPRIFRILPDTFLVRDLIDKGHFSAINQCFVIARDERDSTYRNCTYVWKFTRETREIKRYPLLRNVTIGHYIHT